MSAEQFVPITYVAVPLQKQLAENEKKIVGKPYQEFFNPELTVPLQSIRQIEHGQMDRKFVKAPSAEAINSFVKGENVMAGSGYAMVDDSIFYVQDRMFMPGVTADMMRWWMMWHPVESERYSLWYPQGHVQNRVADPERLANESLSYAERTEDNINYATEFIGPVAQEIAIHFTQPEALGADPALLDEKGYSFSASGWLALGSAPETCMGLMVHLGRETPEGLEFISQYWMGSHKELNRFPGGAGAPEVLAKVGMTSAPLESMAYEMAIHDMIEYHHLAQLLPRLYAKFLGK